MKKVVILIFLASFSVNAQFGDLFKKITGEEIKTTSDISSLTNIDISNGLKEALNKGITEQVEKLAGKDGFYKNDLVKILLPDELKKVDASLRAIGLSSLADEGLKVLNRAAEDAVGEAIPVFVDAIKGMTFSDAKNILMGDEVAATNYLKGQTSTDLYQKFHPIINSSFKKVGADKVWSELITRYNKLPFTKDVNPDLTSYVTEESLKGVYKMVAVEEKEIRTKIGTRNTDLLQKVFALQDKK